MQYQSREKMLQEHPVLSVIQLGNFYTSDNMPEKGSVTKGIQQAYEIYNITNNELIFKGTRK